MTDLQSYTLEYSDLCDFLDASPTPYHAVGRMTERLKAAGFEGLRESQSWNLEPGKSYFVTRNGSSLIAFRTGTLNPVESGIRLVGAHTDSPCLKIKPRPDFRRHGVWSLGVETYGGLLMNPWFDRDLSIAGRVTHENADGELVSTLIDFKLPIARVPSLAIHLDREANEGRTVNAQKHLPVVMGSDSVTSESFRQLLEARLSEQLGQAAGRLFAWEMYLYDTQGAAVTGLGSEYVSSARLDNLLSCYCGLKALEMSANEVPALLVCNDHEEVGSTSACGAQGPFLRDVLERLVPAGLDRQLMLNRSMMISADNAHAIHPNYADRHEENHGPKINAGPVIKINANQRYATNSENSSVFRKICADNNIPVQEFVTRTDLGCGSTIGPLTAANVGVSTLDVGCPQWAMHSIRETAGLKDAEYLIRALAGFFARTNAFAGGQDA